MMYEKVTLVYPSISSAGFDSYNRDEMDSTWISHGLCSLGAVLKKDGRYVDLLDLRTLKNWAHFEDELRKRGSRVYGIKMLSVDYDTAVEAARRIKKVCPGAIVVTGGPHPTVMTEEVTVINEFDYIVIREGEITFPKLIRQLENGDTPARVLEGEPPDLDSLPFEDRSLFPKLEVPLPGFPSPFVSVIAGRGCMYNCSFCMPAEKLIFGKKVRKRSPRNVVEELCELRDKYGFRSFLIHDDCLTENSEWVIKFCELFRENKLQAVFACQSRADIICENPDMLKLMKSVGLKMVFIGFESGSDRVLKTLRKGVKREQNLEAAAICKRLKLRIWANYMFGVPTETPEEMMETADMIRKILPYVYSPAFFTPHPGSDLYKYCDEHKLINIQKHSDFARNPTSEKIKGVDYNAAREAIRVSQLKPLHLWLLRKINKFLKKKFSNQKSIRLSTANN